MTTTTQKAQDNAPDATSEPAAVQIAAVKAPGEARGRKAPSAFRTISEVADDLRVPQHVLRFWETKFTQVKPLKRGGGRRYYRPEDVALLKKIHHLLYTEGYTIKGVQKLLKGPTPKPEAVVSAAPASASRPAAAPAESVAVRPSPQATPAAEPVPGLSSRQKAILESMLGDLKDLRNMIRGTQGD